MPDGHSMIPLVGPPPPSLQIVVQPHPFSTARSITEERRRLSIAEIVALAKLPEVYARHVRVWVDDYEVPPHLWPATRPKFGRMVYVRIVPLGGGGGGRKNPLAMILSLAVAAAGFFLAGPIAGAILGEALAATGIGIGSITLGQVVTGIVSATINLVGNLAISALVKPPQQQAASIAAQPTASPAYQLTGTQNRAAPYAPIPRIFGKRRIYPVLAARPYTEGSGDQQYIRMLLLAGYGPLRLSDICIGSTPISAFIGVEIEILEGWPGDPNPTLYTQTIREEQFTIELKQNVWNQRTTKPETSEISIDIGFPRGLATYNANTGARETRTVTLQVQYRAVGASTWIDAPFEGVGTDIYTAAGNLTIAAATNVGVRYPARWKTGSAGQWEVRVLRGTVPAGDHDVDASYWSAFRSIKYQNPLPKKGLAVIALRIKASEQLNGVPDQINCLAESYLQVWNGSSWSWAISRNAAWAYCDVLKRRGTDTLLPDSRIDLDGMMAWAAANDANAPDRPEPYWTFDAVFENGSVFNALREIAGSARAAFTMKDGKYSIMRDVARSTPVMHITPRNSWGYSGKKEFIDLPHAFKVRFVNEDADFAEDERIVYADGYDENNATRFETLDMMSVARATQAWREGRYFLAQGTLRPEEHAVWMDIEAIRGTLGDPVQFAHDVVSIGLAQGRIKAVATSGPNTIGFTLDGVIRMEAGKSYAMRCRKADGTSTTVSLVTVAGDYATVDPVTPIPTSGAPDVGDLFMFGEATRESAPMLIKRVDPGPNLTARVTLVDAQPGVWTADSAPIPAFDSYITHQGNRLPFDAPAVTEVISDDTALIAIPGGGWQAAIRITLAAPSGLNAQVDQTQVYFRRTGTNDPWQVRNFPQAIGAIFVTGVDEAQYYDLKLRYVSEAGAISEWFAINAHYVVGRTAAPPAPDQVLIQGSFIVATYPNPPRDFDGFRVEYHRGVVQTRDGATRAHASPTIPLPFDTTSLPPGTLTIFVMAVDTTGNESEPVILVKNIAGPTPENVVDTVDYAALFFPGSYTNCSVVSGALKADAAPGSLFLPDGDAEFLPVGSDLFLPVTYQQMQWVLAFAPDPVDVPALLYIDATILGQGWMLEYRPPDDNLFLPNGGDAFLPVGADPFIAPLPDFQPMPASFEVQAVSYDFRVTVYGGSVRGEIDAFAIKLDVPDEEEVIEDLVLSAGGTRAPITKTYRAIRHVSCDLQFDGNGAVNILTMDKDETLGPLLQGIDGTGAHVAALVDVRIKGIRQG